jgi:hypothetical protein
MSGDFMAALSSTEGDFSVSLGHLLGVFAAIALSRQLHAAEAGRAFVRSDSTPQRALQRYIDLTQRREKFLLLG